MKTVKETTWKVVEEYQNGELTRVTQDIKETIYEQEDEKKTNIKTDNNPWQIVSGDTINCDCIKNGNLVFRTEEDTISGVAGVR